MLGLCFFMGVGFCSDGYDSSETWKIGICAGSAGNGSLLLAVALMTAGYPGSGELPGFPKDGTWAVEFEGIQPFCC